MQTVKRYCLKREADGRWVWSDRWSHDQVDRYANDGAAEAIPAYLTTHPVPDDA